MLKNDPLPRQARDEHKDTLKKEVCSAGSETLDVSVP
jgi:hypothetical protein